jgi:hypothetical protein
MTAFQWVVVAISVVGLILTVGGHLVTVTRAVERNKADSQAAIKKAAEGWDAALAALRKEFEASQKSQDRISGEMGAALRRFIEGVEKEMHAIELWGRDHYVQKPDFDKAIDTIRGDLKGMASEIKDDFRELYAKIDQKAGASQ